MKKMLQISMLSSLVLILAAGIVLAADLPAKDAKILEEAGIPVFKGAEYVNGNNWSTFGQFGAGGGCTGVLPVKIPVLGAQ